MNYKNFVSTTLLSTSIVLTMQYPNLTYSMANQSNFVSNAYVSPKAEINKFASPHITPELVGYSSTNIIEASLFLFEELRDFTVEELTEYNHVLDSVYKPTGLSIF